MPAPANLWSTPTPMGNWYDGKGFGEWSTSQKTNYALGRFENAIAAGGEEAFRLRDLEEARGAKAEDTLTKAITAANKPTLTQDLINLKFGRSADTAGSAFMQSVGNLRSMLGASGLSGGSGYAGGIAANLEAQRLGSMIGARRDLMLEKANTDAADRLKQYDRMTQLAQVQARPVAAEGSDFLNNLIGLRGGMYTGQLSYNAAKQASKAGETAGWMGLAGQLGGALIGAL